MKGSRNLLLAGAVAAILSPVQAAVPAEVDTSEWKCEQCPFPTGSEVTARLGGGNVSDSSAKFGEYNGLDEDGGYVIANVEGTTRLESGWYLDYEGHKLGLDTRDAAVTMGKEGLFSARLFYDAMAKRTFDDTASPFAIGDDGRLTLPSTWVRGTTTGQMTQLNALLRPVDIGHERKAAGAEFDVRLGRGIGLFASFRREDKEGTGYAGVGNFTTALQLPEPIDSSTDSYEFGVKWDGASAYARLSYYVQKYDNDLNSITWDNPYVTFGNITTGRKAAAPDNESEQILLSAGIRLELDTSVAFKAMIGSVSQDDALLPYTITTALSPGPLPRTSLNGDLDIAHYALSLASRPFDKVRVRGSARIDERKDKTADITFADGYVESDMLSITGVYTPQRYDYERRQGEIEGEYEVLDGLGLFLGARGEELERTEQDVDKTTEGTGYSGIRLSNYEGATMVLRVGESHRDADDTRTPDPGENPSFWKYNLANRDRDFGDIKFSWAVAQDITVSIDGTIANDIYRRSPYGLKEGSDRRGAANITWMPQEGLSIYLDGGYQQVKALQTNLSGSPAAEWRATHKDVYKTFGGGARWTAANDKLEVSLDLAEAKSDGAVTTETGTDNAFPRNTSDLKAARLAGWYKVSDSLRIGAAYRYEKLETTDWALQGVDPAAVPTLLALGADPYNYKVNVFSLTVRYDFGPKPKKQ